MLHYARSLRHAALVPLLAAGLSAQGSLHFLVGFAGDNTNQKNSVPVSGLYDLDHDGKIAPRVPELFAFVTKVFSTNGGKGGFIEDEQHIVEAGDISFYIADAGDGWILKARDKNANGVIEATEIVKYAKIGTPTQQSTFGPNSLAVTRVGNGIVNYIAVNSDTRGGNRTPGLWRAADGNNDGDALDLGEMKLLLNGRSGTVKFPGKSGTVTLTSDRWERIRTIPRFGNIIAWQEGRAAPTPAPDAFCYYGFKETGGKVTKNWVFFNPSLSNGLPANADLKSGKLEDLDIEFTSNNQKTKFNGFRFCEVDQNGDRNVFPAYYFTNTYGAARSFGSKNAAGNPLHGVVLRGVDKNNDGDLQDAGEVTIFFNGAGKDLKGGAVGTVKKTTWQEPTRGTVSDIAGFVTGLAEGEGVVYLLIENGSNDAVIKLTDKNKNNVIENGEVTMIYETPAPPPPVFSKNFGPFSLELHAIDRSLVVDPLPKGATPFGQGCLTSAGLDPRTSITGGGPVIGNAKMRVELKRGNSSKASFLFLGFSNKFLLGTIPLPIPLTALGMKGCSQLVSTEFVFPTINNNSGGAWLPLPIPSAASLRGAKLYVQWWTQDQNANAANLVTSNGMELVLQ